MSAVSSTGASQESTPIDASVGRLIVDFDAFYRSEFSRFVALAVALTGEMQLGEDVAQDALVDAHRRWQRIGRYDSPRAWVRRVVVQRCAKVTKRRSNERVALLRSVGPGHAHRDDPEVDPSLLDALGTLPDRQRVVVALHYLDDAPIREIAQLLDISEGSVKTHLSRARASLATALDREAERGDGTETGT